MFHAVVRKRTRMEETTIDIIPWGSLNTISLTLCSRYIQKIMEGEHESSHSLLEPGVFCLNLYHV